MTLEHSTNAKQRVRRTRKSKDDVRADRVNEGQRQIKEKFLEERKQVKPVQAKNEFQKKVLRALATKQVIVISSPAGTGKSLLSVATASDALMQGKTNKMFLARPAVGMGNTLGFLKGDLRQKYEPYLMPLIEVVKDRYGIGVYESGLNTGTIELLPFEYLRGRNISGWAVVDEVQGCSSTELYSILTRITEDGKLILLGDKTQSDVKGKDGLTWLREFVERHNLWDTVEFIEGDSEDIVRSEFVKRIVQARENDTGNYANHWEEGETQ
jgi:phosphate starvation-inducible PhoH-like protein